MSLSLPYTLKRLIAQFIMPVPFVIELFVLGWLLQRFTRFRRTGTSLKVIAGCLFLAFAYGWGGTFLYRLERQYPPFDPTPEQCERLRGCDVVVLGQGMAENSDIPVRFRDTATFMQRLLEGVRVNRLIPESRLLVSMAGDASVSDKNLFLDEYAKTVGVPRERFAILDGAHDTSEEARFAMATTHTNVLIIVTSASHIPRAVRIFEKTSAHPIPAPCDYVRLSPGWNKFSFSALPLPSSSGLNYANTAAHEWMGTVYESITP